MGPLTLNQFDITILNNTPEVHCSTQRDSLALCFRKKEREREGRKGGKRRREGRGEEMDGISNENNSHQHSFIGKNR